MKGIEPVTRTDRTPSTESSPNPAEESTPATSSRRHQWVRLWVDFPTDPKFRIVARQSRQPLSAVLTIFVILLADAANRVPRGSFGLSAEEIAATLDLEDDAVTDILKAMQGRVLDGSRLTGWEVRQPIREDDSADRVRNYRERLVTHGNAAQRTVTLEESREEKK